MLGSVVQKYMRREAAIEWYIWSGCDVLMDCPHFR